ncbi:hypothetical protein ACR720_04485 [Sphingomonas parapaucimobilis]|uniref:hypothetical protein n=1 Tax=Sphingomonas parapaucimobilis TaxID=28213 RepID=UPI0039E9B20C
MRVQIFGIIALLAAASCSPQPNKVDIDFDNLAPMSPEHEKAFDDQQRLVKKRFNERARSTNMRMAEAYERGQEVCRNLQRAGHQPGRGCPRPKPKYVEYMQ